MADRFETNDDSYSNITARAEGTHIGIGAHSPGVDMIFWDPNHELWIGTQQGARGNTGWINVVMKLKPGGDVEIDGISIRKLLERIQDLERKFRLLDTSIDSSNHDHPEYADRNHSHP